jgi:hypothetical protein
MTTAPPGIGTAPNAACDNARVAAKLAINAPFHNLGNAQDRRGHRADGQGQQGQNQRQGRCGLRPLRQDLRKSEGRC